MIIDAILGLLKIVLDVVLLPLTPLNFVINLGSHIPVVTGFIRAIAYLFPWSQIMPLITIVISIFGFRAIVALIKTIWAMIPVL